MASGDQGQLRGSPEEETAREMVVYRGQSDPMHVNGNGEGSAVSQHGEEEDQPANVMLRQIGAVAAAAARRATLLTVAEWTQRAVESLEATIRGMGEAIGQQLELVVNQMAAAQ